MSDVFQVDPTQPQSAFPYDRGVATPGTPTGSEALLTASGQLNAKQGVYYLQAANDSPMTIQIPAPTAGSSASGGDDGNQITFVSVDGLAHIIQSGSNGSPPVHNINGADYRATFSGSPIGRVLTLHAYNGIWYTGSTVTLS